jgi:hypothetical protein
VRVRFLIGVVVLFALVAGCGQQVTGVALPVAGGATSKPPARPSTPKSRPSATRTATPSASAGAQVPVASMEGDWEGTYTCSQGETGLKLAIQKANAQGVANGKFEFFPVAGNPSAKSGSYEVNIGYSPSAGGLKVTGLKWIQQPDGYVMVDLLATGTPTADKITGRVLDPSCSTFTITRK